MDGVEHKTMDTVRHGRRLSMRGAARTRPQGWGARIIATLLRNWMHALFHIEVRGLEHFSSSPSTLVVANHLRDTDGPIIGTTLLDHMDAHRAGIAPYFVAREDLFRRGFLRDYLTSWPEPVRELLAGLDLRPFLDVIHLYPMRRVRERTLGEVLEDILVVFGDLPLDEVLRPTWTDRFLQISPLEVAHLRVTDALQRGYRSLLRERYGLTKLTRARLRALMPYERATIDGQLHRFVELLEHGAVVQLEPEGTTSVDGSLGRMRGGLHVLLNRPRVPVRVLPVGITYDFMTTGRQWAFINVGREIPDLQGLSLRDTTTRVTAAMLACSTLTASQLASRWLLGLRSRGGGYVTRGELEEQVRVETEHWSARGVNVDPRLLEARARRQRVSEYLDYCRRSAALLPCGGGRYLIHSDGEMPPPSWTDPDSAFKYVHNELMSLRPLWPEVAGRGEL